MGKPFNSRNRGFTIIELLIVIVVIGILAAIVLVLYSGVKQNAAAAALKSDLASSQTQLGIDNTLNGTFPATLAAANGGQGLKSTNGTTYQYTYTSATNSYCLSATSSVSGVPGYHISNDGNGVQANVCTGDTPPGGAPANGGVVATIAGSSAGFNDATGTSAKFNNPQEDAVDASGNVYIADSFNQRIRKMTPAGVVTTLAGSGTAGSANGTGTAAQFNYPYGIAVDSSGNVYVSDAGSNLIRKITAGGAVTTLAGSGSAGSTDGTGTAASFNQPFSVAVDSSGNLYVADYAGNRIRKITSGGVVTTFAGSGGYGHADGTGTAATFANPQGVAVDSSGNVYVADTNNDLIRKITSAGVVSTLAGSGSSGFSDGTGAAAQFSYPYGLAVDSSGIVYVADYANQRIRKITSAGVVTTLAGSGTAGPADGTGTSAQFNYPSGVAIDSSGTIYISDTGNSLIRTIR